MIRAPLLSLFTVRAGEYEHFTITAAGGRTIGLCVIALAVGVMLAALYNFYLRRVPGGVARRLLDAGALSPETAKTAGELGLAGKRLALFELTRGSALSHIVRRADERDATDDPSTTDEPANPTIGSGTAADTAATEARYYIPEELKYRAEIRFDKKGNGLFALLFTCAAAVGLAVLVIALLPWFLGVIDKFM